VDLVDLVIIILFIAMVVRGSEIGFIRQVFATLGFVGGIFLGAVISPRFLSNTSSEQSKALWTIFIVLLCGLVLLTVGEYVGVYFKRKVIKHKVNKLDAIFGSVLGVITLLATIWLAASVLIKLPYQGLVSEIQQSSIVGLLDKELPAAPDTVARLGRIIAPNGFPQVFVGNEPAPTGPVTLPSSGTFTGVVNADAASVVKVEGLGCGGIVEGSGFVASNGLIITNAHVVAGVTSPYVVDQTGKHTATPIWFDPNLDLSVLKVSGLNETPLKIDTNTSPRGTQGEVMGYPGGGPLTAKPAAIMDEFIATGRNIYNEGSTDRDVYEIQADVIPGNSGGPLINIKGQVIGIVFAQSTVYAHVGYALTMKQVVNEFTQAQQEDQVVGTGTCAE
jgi:S1-C subfamily serine protease